MRKTSVSTESHQKLSRRENLNPKRFLKVEQIFSLETIILAPHAKAQAKNGSSSGSRLRCFPTGEGSKTFAFHSIQISHGSGFTSGIFPATRRATSRQFLNS